MIHRDDSMCHKAIQRNSHNKAVRLHPSSMLLRVELIDTANPRICRNRRALCPRLGEQVAKRSKCMALRKARSMAQEQDCTRVRSIMGKICRLKKRRGSKRNNINNTHQTLYMEWPSNSPAHRLTTRSHNTGQDRTMHLKHWPPSLGCHKQLNTTLQDSLVRLAHLHPNYLRNNFLPNTNNLTRILRLELRPLKRIRAT